VDQLADESRITGGGHDAAVFVIRQLMFDAVLPGDVRHVA
jgi:hypothetical protein